MDGNGDFHAIFVAHDLVHHPIETHSFESGCLEFQVCLYIYITCIYIYIHWDATHSKRKMIRYTILQKLMFEEEFDIQGRVKGLKGLKGCILDWLL